MQTIQKSICDLCVHLPICKLTPQASCTFWASREAKSPLQPVAPVAKKRALFRSVWIWSGRIAVAVCLVLAFVAGRLSTLPRIVSLLPRMSSPVEDGAAPDAMITQFFQALRLADTEKLLTMVHPDAMGYFSDLASTMQNTSEGLTGLKEVKILQITFPEETADVLISLLTSEGATSGKIALKKHHGEWKILNFY